MKHLFSSRGLNRAALMLLLCAAAAFVSCGSSSRDEISASQLKSQYNDHLKDADLDIHSTEVKVGYYEENDADERYVLRQLAAAGVLTYKVERIEHKVSVRTGYDWWTGRNTYKQVNKKSHFVTVELTDAGKKCIMEVDFEPEAVGDPDLVNRNDKHYPEFDVPEEELFPEDKKEQPAPAPEQPAAKPAPAAEPAAEPAPEPKSAYEQAKEREEVRTFDVKTSKLRVAKVRNIRLADGEAYFEVILEYCDVTPFGRVIEEVYDGDRKLVRGSAVYYEDKGWTLNE